MREWLGTSADWNWLIGDQRSTSTEGAETMRGQPFYRSLYLQVLIAIVIGAALGYFFPHTGAAMKPLGDGFIKLIKMMIAPIIFCTVVLGIAGMENMKAVGKTGALAILYFEVLSSVALVIGLVIVNLVGPGRGMNVDPASLDAKAVAAFTGPGKLENPTQFLLDVIPDSAVGAFAKGDILQVLFFAILFGFALHLVGERGKMVYGWIEQISHILFKIVGIIMKVAPLGAFGAMAFTIGKYGLGTLTQLGKLMACFYVTCLLFIFVVLGIVARLHGFSIFRFVRYIKEELFLVLGTSSSEVALPRIMVKLENLGRTSRLWDW
jgi:aerobic C4-dicarboxylate transport protein